MLPYSLSTFQLVAATSSSRPKERTDSSMILGPPGWNPPRATQFNHHMGRYRCRRPAWMDPDVYPMQESLIAGFNHRGNGGNPVMLVDIGGSYGHDLVEFRRKYPEAPGRLVLQDLDRVLQKVTDLRDDIEAMPYNFLDPQPVRGARAYYLHQILHDYPDGKCVRIIQRVKGAMEPGYSKLLLYEHIIPAVGANWEATYLDLYMMVLFSAREWTEDDWRSLIQERCGLRICSFWNPRSGVEGVIESYFNYTLIYFLNHLVNAGSNDCLQCFKVEDAGKRMGDMLEYLWLASPGSTILLSTLLVNADKDVDSVVAGVNNQLRALAKQKRAKQKKVVLVDMYTSEGPDKYDLVDGTHPGDHGYNKMARLWFRGVEEALGKGFIAGTPRTL